MLHPPSRGFVPILGAVLWLTACGAGGSSADGGTPDVPIPQDAVSDGVSTGNDVSPAVDAPPDDALLFHGCTADSECGPGGLCETTFATGLCTRGCLADEECGDNGVCVPVAGAAPRCRPLCTQAGDECVPFGAGCEVVQGDLRACVPACSTHRPPACAPGLTCDVYRSECSAAVATSGGDNGDPCGSGADCRSGSCQLERRADGSDSGWVGGYCVSFAQSPGTFAYAPGRAMPQGDCPDGSAIPPDGSFAGDMSVCLRSCVEDVDCRAGYICDRLFTASGQREFTTGVCYPIDCHAPFATCPTGYECRSLPGETVFGTGRCVRSGGL